MAITPAPAATNLANGIYSATLLVTNVASQAVQTVTVNLLIGQPLVFNGGFETGDFTDWNLNANDGGSPYNFVASASSGIGISPHSGTYFMAFGEVGTPLASLSQTLLTVAGQKYLLSLWLNSSANPASGHQTTPNEFSVSWNGGTIYDKSNIGNVGWANLQFVVTATSTSTVLQFGGRDDPFYLGLDDVSAIPVFAPTISTQPANLTILSGSNAIFNVTAGGSTPLAYHWRKNGTNISNGGNISGATTNVLTLTAVTTNNAGNYSLVITNAYGSITSAVATLTVVLPPAIAHESDRSMRQQQRNLHDWRLRHAAAEFSMEPRRLAGFRRDQHQFFAGQRASAELRDFRHRHQSLRQRHQQRGADGPGHAGSGHSVERRQSVLR